MNANDAWKLIEEEAAKLGVGYEAIAKWRSRGVPHRHRISLLRLAAERGVTLSDEHFGGRPAILPTGHATPEMREAS